MPFYRKHFFWIVTICFALAMGFELRHLGPKLFGSGQNKDEQARSETRMKITEYVSNLRKNLPMRIDEATVLVDVRAEDLSVKFMNEISGDMTKDDFEAHTEELKALVNSQFCKGQTLVPLLRQGASFTYSYRSANEPKPLFGSVMITSCP